MKPIVVFALVVCFAVPAHAISYSEAVRTYCRKDYKAYCGEYGLETNALRLCMDRHGDKLSKSCVRALVESGEVSQREVDRRKNASGR
jgi:hypothetical protein